MPEKFLKKPTISFRPVRELRVSRKRQGRIQSLTGFRKKVYEIVRKIPKGKVLTYKKVAELADYPKAYRAVGNILNKSASWRTKIPCHRVVRSDGKVGGYKDGLRKKAYLLKKEGVVIKNRRVAL